MYTLCLNLLCALATLGTARASIECCENIKGFKDCKRQCEKVWHKKTQTQQLAQVQKLPNVCPSHLVSLWKCFNSSIQGLHLYIPPNYSFIGKSCCLLATDEPCRNACFRRSDTKELKQICPSKEGQLLLRCIDRNKLANERCCRAAKSRKCKRACQSVLWMFLSGKDVSKKKIRTVKRKCKKNNHRVFTCVKDYIGNKVTLPDHKCCQMSNNKKCKDACREVVTSKKSNDEKLGFLKESCKADHHFYHPIWRCFLEYVVPIGSKDTKKKSAHKADVRLHCCLRAKTPDCLKLCLKSYSEGGEAAREFNEECAFKPSETTMFTCIADVSEPCHIGCRGLEFCTNFNNRHTELFRSCNREADRIAKYELENWWKEGRVKIPAMDVIPVKDIKKCLPDVWKAVACVLQVKPCHVKSHSSAICRKDCLKILGECAKKQQLGVNSVETICKRLSPDEQSPCISLESYTKPSPYKNETNEVTHPCYPNPCKHKGVCEINRDFKGQNDKNAAAYRCTPGCPIDLHSKLRIRNGEFARFPVVQDDKLGGCFEICRCDKDRLSDCPRLPSCVLKKSCGTKKKYKHQEKFYSNCNFCVCFDGEVTCSEKQCLPETANNGRPRRNHSPNDDSSVLITGSPCSCSAVYRPVCGVNGKTYRNFCFARCARLSEGRVSNGTCSSINPCSPSPCGGKELCVIDRKICIGTQASCPQYVCVPKLRECSNSTPELLCDEKNKQHLSKCSLRQNVNEIAYSGLCKDSCAPGRREVCGIDGQTYSSVCALNHARMLMDYEGPCKTVGKYSDEEPTVGCAYVKCPGLKPSNCIGVTPPGACCKICATQLVVLFSEKEISNTNKIVMDQSRPITQKQVVSRVRKHLSVSECDLFGFYSTHGDFVLFVKTITENPTKLQFLICKKEAQKIETMINTASPVFTSDEILSSFRAVALTNPRLSKQKSTANTPESGLTFLVSFMLCFIHAWST